MGTKRKAGEESQLTAFIEKFTPAMQKEIRAVRAAMRRRLPHAFELAYDNYNFFVIGYSPTEHPSDAVFSIAASAKGVSLCFIQGAALEDPAGVLQGDGKQTRFIRLESAGTLKRPEVEALVAAAIDHAGIPFRKEAGGTLVIRSVSAKQRPRKKG